MLLLRATAPPGHVHRNRRARARGSSSSMQQAICHAGRGMRRLLAGWQAGRAMMGPLLLPAVLLLVLQTAAAAPRGRRVSGATRFASCGDTMCDNMTAQVAQIVQNAATVSTVMVYSGGAAPQYNTPNFGACYVGTEKKAAVEGNAAFQAAFRFPSAREPEAGLCTPKSDAIVTTWANPLRAAGVAIMPVIQGQYRHSNWTAASQDQNFFTAAVHVAQHFHFAGWALDVENVEGADCLKGAEYAAQYAHFLQAFSAHLKANNLRLTTYEPNGFTEGPWRNRPNAPHVNLSIGYYDIGHAAEVQTMDTYCEIAAFYG